VYRTDASCGRSPDVMAGVSPWRAWCEPDASIYMLSGFAPAQSHSSAFRPEHHLPLSIKRSRQKLRVERLKPQLRLWNRLSPFQIAG